MNHSKLTHDMKLSLQHIKANSKKVNNELHLAEGIGFRPNNTNNEKLTVLCSQIEQENPNVLVYPINTERLTAEVHQKQNKLNVNIKTTQEAYNENRG